MSNRPSPDYRALNQMFGRHIRSFGTVDDRVKAHFDLKIRHTYEVVRNIEEIAIQEGMDERTVQLARVIALLHDLGRFRQFMEFGTFDDTKSLNHAELSVRVIEKEGFGKLIPEEERDVVTRSILQHNQPEITVSPENKAALYSRLLRDADKIDIWKLQSKMDVVYALGEFGSQDQYTVPAGILDCFREKRIVRLEMAGSLNDFRLLRLGWIFDMHFRATFRHLVRKDYATRILSKIPASPELRKITGIINQYMLHRSL